LCGHGSDYRFCPESVTTRQLGALSFVCLVIPGLKSSGSVRHYSAPTTGVAARVYMFEKSRGLLRLFRNGRFVEQERGAPEAEL
jgi:hypothetical protein